MLSKLYAKWMYAWETALTTRDTNRIVRPLEWGFDWLQDFSPLAAAHAPAAADTPAADDYARMIAINADIVARAEEFFGYKTPTDFRRFTSPVRTRYPENDTVNARWFPAPDHKYQKSVISTGATDSFTVRGGVEKSSSLPRTPHSPNGKPKQAMIVMPQWNADAFSH